VALTVAVGITSAHGRVLMGIHARRFMALMVLMVVKVIGEGILTAAGAITAELSLAPDSATTKLEYQRTL
jgi:hypothetical protein